MLKKLVDDGTKTVSLTFDHACLWIFIPILLQLCSCLYFQSEMFCFGALLTAAG